MAKSGTIQAAIRTGYRLQIAWTVDSQSVANNTSTVTAKVQLVSTGSSYTINSSASKSGSLTINGTKYTFSFSAALNGNQTKTMYTKTVTVAHASDGSKTCAFAASCGINVTLGGTYYGNVPVSGNGTFDVIARASAISSVTGSVSVNGTNAVTVAIDRKSSGFTHTVVFSFGSYSKSFSGVGVSQSYAIPQSWLNAIPSATSGTAKVTVTTYSGNAKIGSAVSKSFTLTVPASVVPTISGVTIAETVSGLNAQFGGFVQSKSKAKVTITATGALGSTIKTYKTTIDGKSYTGSAPTTGTLGTSGNRTLTVTVTDSRGRTASATRTVTVLPYAAPKISTFQGFRCLSDGKENYEGTYLSAKINYNVSAIGNKNTASYRLEYKLQSADAWTTLTSGTGYALADTIVSASGLFGVDNTFDVRLSVTDFFGTVRSAFELPTAFTLLDFNKSGRGVAFGKVSELAEGVEFALPTVFSHAETPSSVTYLAENQDLDTVLEPGFYAVPSTAVSGTLLNKPYTGTATASLVVLKEGNGMQKAQILHVGSKPTGRIFERCYYTNAWGAWHTVYNGTGNILWSGAMYMTATHKITLAEPISYQPSGIVLVFSRYDNGVAAEHNYNSFFVPKVLVAEKPGVGSAFQMNTVNFSMVATKYLYINDATISGNDSNDDTGTSNGVTYNNAAYVLRYVIGV